MEGIYRKSILIVFCFTCLVAVFGQNKPSYEVERLPVSSDVFNDMAPVIVADGLLFCSNRRNSLVKTNRTWEEDWLYDIYLAEKSPEGRYRTPKIFSKELSSVVNEGPLCFTPDGNTVYFTRSIEAGKGARKKSMKNRNGIFIADKQGESWVNLREFEYNNPDYHVAHPSISSDGRFLFFASDMPGGLGKSDIWYCEFVNSRWSEPVNAGPAVNTKDAELYPNMHASGRLYFSSDRQPARPGPYGGLDIYYSTVAFGEWTEPVLLGEPINSTADDFAFAAYSDGQTGYFSSSRRRSDDIYSFKSIIIRKDDCSPLEINSFCYEFYEVNAVKYDTIPFEFEWDFGDGNKAKGVRAEHCFDGPGTYMVSLNSVNLVTGEIQYNEVTYELVIELIEQAYITGRDTLAVGEAAQFDALETHLPGWNIGNYYWNFGDETVAEGDRVNKSYLQTGVFDIQLIVSTAPDRGGVVQESCVSKRVVVVRNP